MNSSRSRNRLGCTGLCLLLWGCGGVIADEAELNDGLDGIYRVSELTLNASSCDREGPTEVDDSFPPLFFVQLSALDDEPFLWVVSCSEPGNCRAKAQQIRESGVVSHSEGAWVFGVDALARFDSGYTVVVGPEPPSCAGGSIQAASIKGEPGLNMHIEVRISLIPEDGSCDSSPDELSCSQLRVITGTFEQAL